MKRSRFAKEQIIGALREQVEMAVQKSATVAA